ncbi:MAG: OFA family MFS transporter [Christensenellales bacterium]
MRIVVVVACLLIQLCVGILYLWSVFNNAVTEHFGWNARSASMVSSFMIFGFVLGNLIGGFLQDKTNPRLISFVGCFMFCLGIFLTSLLTEKTVALIYLTYSGLGGLGCGFAYGCVLSCLQKWFPDNRGFASGLSVSAFGLSTVLFGPVAQTLLNRLGVPHTFMTLAGVFLLATMTACCFVRLPPRVQSVENQNKPAQLAEGLTPLRTMRLFPFWCIALSCFFINATWNIVVPVIKSLGMERGLSESIAVLAVSITGIANAAGRLGMATASDKIGRTNTIIFLAALTAVCAVALIWAQGVFYVTVIADRLCPAVTSATFPAMTTDISGGSSGTNYGIAAQNGLLRGFQLAQRLACGSDGRFFRKLYPRRRNLRASDNTYARLSQNGEKNCLKKPTVSTKETVFLLRFFCFLFVRRRFWRRRTCGGKT